RIRTRSCSARASALSALPRSQLPPRHLPPPRHEPDPDRHHRQAQHLPLRKRPEPKQAQVLIRLPEILDEKANEPVPDQVKAREGAPRERPLADRPEDREQHDAL